MPNPPQSLFAEERPVALVISHERSGTHFLMNALAACYGYVSNLWIDLDRHALNINYYYPEFLRNTLLALARQPLANVVKSHHQAEFFTSELDQLTRRYVFLYIYRDPVAVLLSYWRYLHGLPWSEGPRTADPLTFALAEPCGQMLRYQMRQHANLMQRWGAHVEGWLSAAEAVPGIVSVRYEDLDSRYEETMRGLAGALGRPPQSLARPARDINVVQPAPRDPATLVELPDPEPLRALCRTTVGPLMARLGYLSRSA